MNYYDNGKLVSFEWEHSEAFYNFQDNIYKLHDDKTFHIGREYIKDFTKTVFCTRCNGKEFNVGRGDYYTAIKCIKCGWEICIHEG